MLNFNSEHLEQDPGYVSNRRLLVGIDAPLTASTEHALHTIGEFIAPYSVHVRLLLLNVIPIPNVGGKFAPPVVLSPTPEQRKQAAEALREACAILQEYAIARSHIQALIRVGTPADELVRLAGEQHIDCLIIGSRGSSPLQRLRRVFMGSTSHSILRQALCPIMVVTLPRPVRPADLVAWYEAAIRQVLHNHPTALVNITHSDVVGQFLPPHGQISGRQERTAAAQALERLESSGLLYSRSVNGEMHYLND